MSEIPTPICDLIELLLSRGTVPGDALAAARLVEAAGTSDRGSTLDQRERWRVKKERQRARRRGLSPGTNPEGILTKVVLNTQVVKEKVSKKKPAVPLVPGDIASPTDDWPEDHLEQFWQQFPPYRRQAKAKVGQKLQRIRASKVVTWAVLFGGVLKFSATDPGEFAPAPIVWLNDGRWDREYGPQRAGGLNGKATSTAGRDGFSSLAARLRQRINADAELPHRGEPASDHGPHR